MKISVALVILCCILVPGVFSNPFGGMELEVIGGFGNLAFDHNRKTALSEDPDDPGAFSPQYFPLVLTRLSGASEGFAYDLGFERDPLMRNRLFSNIKVDTEYFFIEAGPFIGLFNSSKLPFNPGVSVGLGLMYPGIVFAELRASSTLGIIKMDEKGNNSQHSADISLGFWVPHVICSLNMSIRNFALREQTYLLIEDRLARYFFSANVHTKNIPFTIKVDLGYQSLKRAYTTQTADSGSIVKNSETDEFKSLFIGLEGTYTFSPELKFLLGGEMPVYSWGVRPMRDPPKGTMLFTLRTGVVWTIPSKNS